MSFISSIFSSSYKRKNQMDTEKDGSNLASKSQTYSQEENLLANLRKSKLFLDDSDMGLQSKASPLNIQSFQEDPNIQAKQDAEKVVGLMISSSKKLSKSQIGQQQQMGQIAEIVPHLKQKSLKKDQHSMIQQSPSNEYENTHNSQLKDILLRSDTKLDGKEMQGSINKTSNVSEFDHHDLSNNRGSLNAHLNTFKGDNQNQSCHLRSSFCQIDSKVLDNSNIPGLSSNIRRQTEANQKLMSAFTFNEEALPALSLVYNSNTRISNSSLHDNANSSHHQNSINQFQACNSNAEVDLSQQKPSSLNDSQSSHLQVVPNQHQSITRGSSNSRVRGSSSKKKQIVSESPLSTKGKREIPSCSYDKYPMLEQIRENISNIIRYQPLVKEDIEGENEGAAPAQPNQVEIFNSQKKQMEEEEREEKEEKVNILNMSAAPNSRINNFFQLSNSKQFDCMSNKAEPPTQMKQRSNSFFFEQSDDKKKFFNLDEIGSKGSNISSKSSSKQSGDKKMQVESPFKEIFQAKSSNKNDGDQEIDQTKNKEAISMQKNLEIQISETQNENQEETDSSRFHSQQKTKSNEQSPNKTHFNSFHKAVDMMIDKSEIPPPHLSRSAHKVPSPIKEVDELSQKNIKNTPKKNEMEVMENVEPKDENTNDFEGSPKMRQKSVKFNNYTPNGQEKEDEEQHKMNLKLQSRKPTPYNPFKSQPISYLSRHNKFKNEEVQSQTSSDSNKDSSQQNHQEIKPADSIISHSSNADVEPKKELKLKYPPIFKDQESSKSKDKKIQNLVSSEKVNEAKPIQNQTKQLSASPLIRTPIALNNQKHPIKQQLALKKKETTSAAVINNNFFKVENTNSTPAVFHSNNSGSTSSSSNGQVNNTKSHLNGFSNKLNSSGSSNKGQNIKQKPLNEEQVSLSEFVSAQRIKVRDESSQPTPVAVPLRGTINSGSVPITQIKNAYKTCIYCQQDIKPKDDVKTFTCCHKAHKSCLPKEKNVKCSRCNSNAMVNKYRPKE
ncbi:hypothetical protein ABPG74_009561 [Tetrahymena malaccensis]